MLQVWWGNRSGRYTARFIRGADMRTVIQVSLLVLIILGSLAGCGQKGPLFREGEEEQPVSAPASDAGNEQHRQPD